MDQLNLIIPELFLTISIMILLMIGVFYKNSFNLIFKLSTIVLLATFILLFNHSVDTSVWLFNNSYIIDYLSLLSAKTGTGIEVISSVSEHGSMVSNLGNIGAILRYNPNYSN